MEFLWFILIGIAAGWLAGQIMKGGGFGVIGDLMVGVIGALLGGGFSESLGGAERGHPGLRAAQNASCLRLAASPVPSSAERQPPGRHSTRRSRGVPE